MHIPYSTLYQRTVRNWPSGRLPIVFSKTPRNAFCKLKKPPSCWELDGISTEPDTWKGVMKILQNQLTSVGRLRIGIRSDALPVKGVFQVGYFQPCGLALPLLVGTPPLPLHFSPDIQMFSHCKHRSEHKRFIVSAQPGVRA